MPEFSLNIVTHTDAGVCCSTTPSTSDAFWLSKKSCEFAVTPEPGLTGVNVSVPDWLARKHRQLVGDRVFEQAKQPKQERTTKMAEQRELSGTLSRNKRRENDRQPEFKGSATIDGMPYWISGWVKQGAEGEKFLLSFKRKDDQPATQTKPAAPAATYKPKHLDDDAIPF